MASSTFSSGAIASSVSATISVGCRRIWNTPTSAVRTGFRAETKTATTPMTASTIGAIDRCTSTSISTSGMKVSANLPSDSNSTPDRSTKYWVSDWMTGWSCAITGVSMSANARTISVAPAMIGVRAVPITADKSLKAWFRGSIRAGLRASTNPEAMPTIWLNPPTTAPAAPATALRAPAAAPTARGAAGGIGDAVGAAAPPVPGPGFGAPLPAPPPIALRMPWAVAISGSSALANKSPESASWRVGTSGASGAIVEGFSIGSFNP